MNGTQKGLRATLDGQDHVEISLERECRTRLPVGVVTGKFDVRDLPAVTFAKMIPARNWMWWSSYAHTLRLHRAD